MVAIFSGNGAGLERGSASVLGSRGLLGAASLGRNGEQVFVNAANGNLLISQKDEFLVGRGPDAAISRTYNSLGDMSDDNADNWRQSTDRRVHSLTGTLNTAGSTVMRSSADGSEILYSWDAAKAAYITSDGAGAHDKLTHAAGIWTWTEGSSQLRETYAAYGAYWRIASQVDTDGNSLVFAYTGANLTRVTTANGEYIEYVWSGINITEIVTYAPGTTPTLTRTRYSYDAYNRLATVTVDLSPEDRSVTDGKTFVTTYTYSGTSKRVASISQTGGSRIDITYDLFGTSSYWVKTISQTSATGVTRLTTFAYDAVNRVTTVTDALGQATYLHYDASQRLTKIVAPPADGSATAQIVQFAYNASGDVTTITDANASASSFTYDSWGNMLTETNRLGQVVTRTYGAKNELLTETRTGSNTASAAAAHTTRYVYDVENHLRYVIGAEGTVTEYRYTATGELNYTIQYPEHAYDVSALAASAAPTEAQLNAWRDALVDRSSTRISLNSYDLRGNLTAILDYGYATTTGGASTAEGYSRTYLSYDQAGRLLSRYRQGEASETFLYDGLGRLIGSTDVNGGTTSIVFNDATMQTVVTLASGLVQTSTYNKAGELVSFTDSGNSVTGGTSSHKYDALGQLRMTTDATGFKSYFLYDRVGRKVADVNHLGEVTEYRYDANDRLVATTRYQNRFTAAQLITLADPASVWDLSVARPAAHAEDKWTWRVHDKEGRVLETIDGEGAVTACAYDSSGRLVKSTAYANKLTAAQLTSLRTTLPTVAVLPVANAAKDRVARTFYDKEGQLVAVLDGEGYLTRSFYDDSGQKIEEVAYLNATATTYRATGTLDQILTTQTAHADDRRTRFVYDGKRDLRYRVDGLNQVTEYVYNVAGKVTGTTEYAGSIAATADYTYDNVKALVAASGLGTNAATRKSWAIYDAAGRIAYSVDAASGVTAYTYDSSGQVIKTERFKVARATTSLPSLATMDSWKATQAGNAGNRVTRQYYTARGELRFTVDAEGYVTRHDFDAVGRATRTVRWDAPIVVDDSATITTISTLVSGATWVDENFTYDGAGRLIEAKDAVGNRTRFEYDADGTLERKIAAYLHATDESVTYFTYDGAGRLKAEYSAYGTADQTLTQYSYDGHGNVLTVTDPMGSVTTRAYDRLGQVLTEANALLGVTSYQYNAFGEAVKVTDARLNATYNYYDRLGRLTVSRDKENYVTETAYNVFGDVTSVTRRYNRANNAASVSTPPTWVAHAQDATTTFEYDRLGRVVKTTDAQGYYEQYTLDAHGNRISVRNKIGGIVTNAYDRRGQLVSETLPMASYDVNGNMVASNVVNRFEYDARGNATKKIEAYGLAEQRTTTYVYDKANRLIETRGDAVVVTSQANHIDTSSVVPTEKLKYDQRGRVIEKTDALGARTLFYYDKKNRKVAEIGALGTFAAYTYDKNGNILTERVYGTAVAVPATAGGAAPAAPGGEYREKSYTYDKLNRLKTVSVANVRSGAWNGSYYATGVGTITTTFDYDSNGNLIRKTDAAGGVTHSFFDKANRKVAEVDAENYLTFYTLDGDGNVTQEERLATRLPGTVTTASDPTALRNSIAGNAADRITQFGYDRNGRRISEWRLYIYSNNIGSGGALGTDGVHGGLGYSYNGLGQVVQKTYGNNDYISYTYDTSGRLIQESRSPYTDQNGASVRPTTFYYYNGVNNLTLTRQGGMTQAAGDRLTRFTYGAGGRLATMTDASGAAYNYRYDAAGNLVREDWVRMKADGSSVTDGMLYTRDLLGRVTSQAFANAPGNYWVRGDSQESAYNAYGDISQRGINGMWQEKFAYDGAGRLYRTNSGDGVWRYFAYDGAGRQTLVLESEGSNLANLTMDQALAVATANGAYYVGGAYIDGINATITAFDKRGLAVQTRAPKRQLSDTAAAQDFTVGRSYNAFGEVASETDARGYTTDYTYNTMGRLTKKQSPTVNYTGENGVVSSARPTEDYYYDRAGRLIGTRDANGNLTTRLLLAGTGHDRSEALVTYEYHADGGYLRNDYDVFGDKRVSWDEINRRTDMAYDAKGRVIQITRPTGLIDYFGYDLLGQKISHWNNVYQTPIYGPPEQVWVEDPPYWDPYYGWVYPGGHWETHTPIVGYTPEKEITDYDLQGRITRQVTFGGDTTTTSYSWNAGIATSGMGTFGGWTETTTMANGRSSTEQTDMFGRQVYRSDLGGHVYTFSYDLAGRMIQRTSGETLNYTWLNTGKVAQSFSATGVYGSQQWSRKGTTYGYDASGNLVSERFSDEGHSYTEYWDPYYGYQYSDYSWSTISKNATATYDGLNRMVTWAEAGSSVLPAASTSYQYDLVGNIRRSYATYRSIDHKGVVSTTNSIQDNWYRYDSMNRLVTKGSLSGGQIVRGYGGVDYLYDKAGQRVSSSRTTQGEAWVYNPYYYYDPYDPYGYGNQYMLVYYDAQTREDYTYDNGGVLTSVRIAQGGYTDNGDGTVTANPAPAYAALRASYTNDLMGRVTRQIDWLGDGTSAAFDRTITYNGKGQITNETVINKQGADTITSYTNNDYGYGSAYALGAITYSSSSTYKNGAYQSMSSTTNSYAWYDGAVQSQIAYKPNTSQSTTHTTTLYYDGSGSLSSIYVGDGRPRSVTFVNDSNGQAIRRDENDNNYNQYTGGDPHDIWYRFGGKQIGAVGNNGTLDTDYATSITNRTRTPGTGAFRFGSSYGTNHANFDLSNESITSYSQGVAAGGYTVRTGDTLETIAASLWGDASLWYKLAEANGMAAANGLVEGQRLVVPAGTLKNHHNATTFKPFDPSETLGDINPTTPQPQKATKKGGKCGVFGIILLVVIAVAVTALTAGAAVAALSPTISSIGAGMSALAAGTTGLSAGALIGIGAASAAMGSIASQGFGVATGIQEKFDWKGVAMAAIGGAVGAGLAPGGLFGQAGAFGNISSSFVSGALRGALSSAVTQGVGVATGLQKKFDWAGVAAAGAGGGVSSAVGARLGDMNKYAAQFISGGAGAVAGAAARSLVNGSGFGDNLLAALPDVIGGTLGNLLADSLGSLSRPSRPPVAAPTDDIIVTADQAAAAGGAQASGSTQQTTITEAELREWRRNNRWDLENIELPADRAKLTERQTEAQRRIAEQTTRRDAVQQELNAARAANAPPRDITRLERRLQQAETRLTRVTTQQNARVAQQQRVVDANVAMLGRLRSIEARALTIALATPVTINERVVGADGKTTTVARTYTPQAAGHQFASAREAAIDGIAISFSMQRILGDNWERGGTINSVGTNMFARSEILLGTRASNGVPAGMQNGRPYVPGLRAGADTVAVFHTHPRGNGDDRNFSDPGDVQSFVSLNTTRIANGQTPLTWYLGGNDGSFDRLTHTTGGSHYNNDEGYRNFFGTR